MKVLFSCHRLSSKTCTLSVFSRLASHLPLLLLLSSSCVYTSGHQSQDWLKDLGTPGTRQPHRARWQLKFSNSSGSSQKSLQLWQATWTALARVHFPHAMSDVQICHIFCSTVQRHRPLLHSPQCSSEQGSHPMGTGTAFPISPQKSLEMNITENESQFSLQAKLNVCSLVKFQPNFSFNKVITNYFFKSNNRLALPYLPPSDPHSALDVTSPQGSYTRCRAETKPTFRIILIVWIDDFSQVLFCFKKGLTLCKHPNSHKCISVWILYWHLCPALKNCYHMVYF